MSDTLTQVNKQVLDAAEQAQRNADDITLLAVSKTQAAEKIAQLYQAGVRNFGENYLQEALEKQKQLSSCDICWHFIGPIQSNKAATIAQHFDWVHSVDRLKVAQKLSAARAGHATPLNICIQVNIDDESSKSGIAPSELEDFAREVKALPNLKLRGLMVIPKAQETFELQCIPFAKTKALLNKLEGNTTSPINTLSMGMSNDLSAAIAEGATIVRIGTALFGKRNQA